MPERANNLPFRHDHFLPAQIFERIPVAVVFLVEHAFIDAAGMGQPPRLEHFRKLGKRMVDADRRLQVERVRRKIVSHLIDKAKGFLENGETLAPVAFVGSFSSDSTIPVLLESSSIEAKDRSALAIEMAAETLNADFIFVLMEAWSLQKDKLSQMDAIIDKYGSVGASPYAVDVVSMALETRYGVWMAEVPIKPKGISKEKRTIGTPEFRHFTKVKGRFVNLLPVKEGAAKLH